MSRSRGRTLSRNPSVNVGGCEAERRDWYARDVSEGCSGLWGGSSAVLSSAAIATNIGVGGEAEAVVVVVRCVGGCVLWRDRLEHSNGITCRREGLSAPQSIALLRTFSVEHK